MLDALLIALVVSVFLTIVSLAWLGRCVPESSSAHAALFSPGDVPPYNFVTSLKAKYFLPWVKPPALTAAANTALLSARIGAMLAVVCLLGMGVLGLEDVWA